MRSTTWADVHFFHFVSSGADGCRCRRLKLGCVTNTILCYLSIPSSDDRSWLTSITTHMIGLVMCRRWIYFRPGPSWETLYLEDIVEAWDNHVSGSFALRVRDATFTPSILTVYYRFAFFFQTYLQASECATVIHSKYLSCYSIDGNILHSPDMMRSKTQARREGP